MTLRRTLLTAPLVGALIAPAKAGMLLLGAGYDVTISAQAQQFFDRLITPPSAARKTLYANLIDGLVAAGVWAKLDLLMVYAAADSGTSFINLVSSSFASTIATSGGGTETFTVDRGWTGNGINGCLNSNFNPTTASGHFTRNDAMAGGWSLTSTQQNFNILTMQSGTADTRILPAAAGGAGASYDVNDNGSGGTVASLDGSGFWIANRTASNAMALFRNGSSLSTSSAASSAPLNQNIVFDPGPILLSAATVGSSLTAGQITSFYNLLLAYLQGVGAA